MSQQVPDTGTQDAVPARTGRITGVDAARALAVFGMFTVHLGVGSIGLLDGTAAEAFHQLTRGRSSALFAFLAGVSLALMSGHLAPLSGDPLYRVGMRVLVRAVVLALLGGLLDLLDAPIAIILTYYGGFFLLALPLLRLRAPALAAVAAGVAALGPQVSFLVRSAMGEPGYSAGSIGGVSDFLITGYYPACTFMAFVVAGMAVGRMDLRSTAVRVRAAAVGLGLVLLGYGGSWLLMYPLGGIDRLLAVEIEAFYGSAELPASDPAAMEPLRQWMAEQINALHGEVPTSSPLWLLVASPHSGTTFEIAGAVGTALLVLTACLVLADLLGDGLYPLTAAGSMALTVYVGHVVVIALIGASADQSAPFRLELFVAGALVLAALWHLILGRGPLERVLGRLARTGADLVVPPDPRPGPSPGPRA
ncbi:putative membrane protein YeiB [Spinactinospora alkalitolerans]|uniref:Putative membrane protein YeiB n=1 Tax=Spinactinospora alkalitolerans TaxID=687207 RepID=A0A852TQG2_9ACTN|nr:heparan-alpha-glucosaminide N-acetyltransferase domain-containing protein [Spinactinospora alkalitolerans]NYE46188.1 putative membrane protein YeiB [Spinactinospora alkalitolerans]